MTPPADPAAKLQPNPSARLREIPSVDELLARPQLAALAEKAGRAVVTQSSRAVLAELRNELKQELSATNDTNTANASDLAAALAPAAIESRIIKHVELLLAPSLVHVINATGVVLHTNLGRAPLPAAAAATIASTATHYSNLEYDVERGERGKRDVHTARLVAQLVGAEAAIVVNNNAAAVFLVLNTLAKNAEVVVSRGELIEIGDGFRIPDIMSESGAILREVGTTNRTRIRDYERAFNERTRLLLRVHPSNFRITGFTERPTLDEIAALGRRLHVPVYEDLGSGCLADLSASGINEPVARASCDAGVDVVSFSGDKLLGGPQAGIIAGKREFIERIRRNPLFRALRVDKLTIAALEVTLNAYLRGALDEIPTLRMIRAQADEIAHRAEALAAKLRLALANSSASVAIETLPGFSVIGGGSTPDQQLPTHLISIASSHFSPVTLETRLRKPVTGPPVIARIEDDRLILDLRTVFPDEEPTLNTAIVAACQ
ncbi:MAG: L-seryl-tRNA(Sec) selenium transferase [Candidatus Acidiferrales bacterium]